MIKLLIRFWNWLNQPSAHSIWSKAFDQLQAEKRKNGRSAKYWRIWNEEVCPAYRILSEKTPKFLRHSETDHILHDMDKPINQRKYF